MERAQRMFTTALNWCRTTRQRMLLKFQGVLKSRTALVVFLVLILASVLVAIGIWLQPTGFDQRNEFVRTVAQVLGGAALLTGLYFTAQNLDNSRRTLQHQRESQFTDRFYKAVEQLHHSEVGVRVAALYALRALYKESSLDRESILQVLIAFVRERSSDREVGALRPPWEVEQAISIMGQMLTWTERILRTIRLPVQLSLDDLDFRNIQLAEGKFTGISFQRSNFSGARFLYCDFYGTMFAFANLQGTTFLDCDMRSCLLIGADLDGADMQTCSNMAWLQINESNITTSTRLPDYLLENQPDWYQDRIRALG